MCFVCVLSQIVGLTASVGVGRGGSVVGAVNHIQELCARLDCTLHTVQKEKEALNRYLKDHKKRTQDMYFIFNFSIGTARCYFLFVLCEYRSYRVPFDAFSRCIFDQAENG